VAAAVTLELLEEALAAVPHRSFDGLPKIDRVAAERSYRQRLADLVATTPCFATRGAFCTVVGLPWDSRLLGIQCARIDHLLAAQEDAASQVCAQALAWARERGFEYITCRVPAGSWEAIRGLESCGFRMIDGIVKLAAQTDRMKPLAVAYRLAEDSDAQSLAELVRGAFRNDRFHRDPEIPTEKADDLYMEWARNSCRGQAAEATILIEREGAIVAFSTCSLVKDSANDLGTQLGVIGLVGAFREGEGFGRQATQAALAWFCENGAEVVEVGTQMDNHRAIKLYHGCGFEFASAHLTLRIRL
jgi:ribosomal protein S18 acetylase RimI-like enzyme